jgi:hypothetical protein
MKLSITVRELNELANHLERAGNKDMADMFHEQVLKMVQNKMQTVLFDDEYGSEYEQKQTKILFEWLEIAKKLKVLRNQMRR